MSGHEEEKIPRYETVHQLSYGIFNAGLVGLIKALDVHGGRIFRRLANASRHSLDSDYPERVASLLEYNGVRRCLAWEDAYGVIDHVKIEEVEKFLGVKFSDEQKLGPLRRIPYHESTLTNAGGKVLVPVYPVSLDFLMGKFPELFDEGIYFGESPYLKGFPRDRQVSCRWILFSLIDEPMDYEEVLKDSHWVSRKEYLVPGVTELIYILTLLVAKRSAQGTRCLTLYNPAARTCDCTPDGQVISVTLRDDKGFALSVICPPGQGYPVGDYPLVKLDVPVS